MVTQHMQICILKIFRTCTGLLINLLQSIIILYVYLTLFYIYILQIYLEVERF